MARKSLFFIFLPGMIINLVSVGLALEKVKLGSAVKIDRAYYLPALTGEEKGFWKENGLDVEWVPFTGATALGHGVTAGAISIAMSPSNWPPTAAERGVPVVMAAELAVRPSFAMWVRGDSPYRHPRDLKGARVGVTGLGSATHIFGRLIVAAHGMEKEVRFVGAGGVPEYIAGLRAGALDAVVTKPPTMAALKVQGIVRELASALDYVPKPWFEDVVFVRKDFARSKPDVVRKMLKGIVQSTDFIRKNPRWTMDKIRAFEGVSEEVAKLIYDEMQFTITGKLDRKAVENIRRVFMEYGILTEKAPAVDDLFTNDYLPS